MASLACKQAKDATDGAGLYLGSDSTYRSALNDGGRKICRRPGAAVCPRQPATPPRCGQTHTEIICNRFTRKAQPRMDGDAKGKPLIFVTAPQIPAFGFSGSRLPRTFNGIFTVAWTPRARQVTIALRYICTFAFWGADGR